jgi:hypothetical protein
MKEKGNQDCNNSICIMMYDMFWECGWLKALLKSRPLLLAEK